MLKKIKSCTMLCALAFAMPTLAENSKIDSTSTSHIPNSSFFMGLGGSYNSVNSKQSIYALGLSDHYLTNAENASGIAQGPATPFNDVQSTFAPAIQLGYFKHFKDSNYLWGVKLSYKYLNSTSTNQNMDVYQGGQENGTTLVGDAIINASQSRVTHELSFIPFIGRSFDNNMVYFGAGPTAFRTKSNVLGVTGYAIVNGVDTNVTGVPANFSNSKWVYGGALTIGMAHYITPSWFVDLNYTYAASANFKNNYTAPFTNINSSGTGYTGTLIGSNSQSFTTQGVVVSMNIAL